jgi:hypothetical protein
MIIEMTSRDSKREWLGLKRSESIKHNFVNFNASLDDKYCNEGKIFSLPANRNIYTVSIVVTEGKGKTS